ncbi:MAG: hypothetical protein FJ405_12340 [Verrucomicrobia bacterium]|nr:hypothetical protein [Verrucomicrobiota bacterium]
MNLTESLVNWMNWLPAGRAAGLLSNTSPPATSEGLVSDLILSGILGAFAGLIVALMFIKASRALLGQERELLPPGKLALVGSAMGSVTAIALNFLD